MNGIFNANVNANVNLEVQCYVACRDVECCIQEHITKIDTNYQEQNQLVKTQKHAS